MPAEIDEEIGLERQRLGSQHAPCRLQQRGLRRIARRLLLALAGRRAQRRGLEHLAVDLARDHPRQRADGLEMRRDHVGRQLVAQRRAQGRAIHADTGLGHDEADQPLDLVVDPQHHRGLADAGLVGQLRFDLAEFDTEAADLDLVVDAAVEDDVAGLVQADRVAGAIQHGIVDAAERVGDELLGGQFGAAMIALCHAGAADQQFALLADPRRTHLLVDDVGGVVGDRPADGDGLAGHDLGCGCDHRRLRRPIGVEDAPARPRPFLHDRRRQGLAAEQDEPQRGNVGRQDAEQRRHRVDHRDAGLRQQRRQLLRIAHRLGARDIERGADEIGRPDLFHREIEGDRRALEDDVVGADLVEGVPGAQEMADVAVADDDRLGRARRAGGVDQIGRLVLAKASGAGGDRDAVIGGVERLGRPQGATRRGRARQPADAGHQALGLRIVETGCDPVDRRLGVERDPGGARPRDGDLRDQKGDATRHPQPDHVAGSDPRQHERPRLAAGGRPDRIVAQRLRAHR